jgi:ligand-binding sensor domain-containing protein/signal transduction histidine kinase
MENKGIYTFLVFPILILLFSCNKHNSITSPGNSPKKTDTILIIQPEVKEINQKNIQIFVLGENGVPKPRTVLAGKPDIKRIFEIAKITPGISYLPPEINQQLNRGVPVQSVKPIKVIISSGKNNVITSVNGSFKEPRVYTIVKPAKSDSVPLRYSIKYGDTIYQAHEKVFPYPQQKAALMPRFKYDAIFNFQYLDVEQGLAHSSVYNIIEDKHGNLWFGTDDFGVSKYDGIFFTDYTTKEGLKHDIMRSIFEDKDGNIWFGTWGGGIDKYDGNTFTHFAKREGFCNDVVRTIYEDNAGNLWFGSLGSGVFKFDGETFTQFTKEQGLSNDSLFSILQDKFGNFWFGTWGNGVCKFDGKTFTPFTVSDGLSSNIVRSIVEDRRGNLWFGTEGGGICRFDGNRVEAIMRGENLPDSSTDDLTQKNGIWVKTFTTYAANQGLLDNKVYAMLEDSPGCFWIGTDKGLCFFDGNSFTNYTEKTGLSNNQIRALHKDDAGNIWIGTLGGGVCKYTPNSFRYFTEKEGLSEKRVSSIIEDVKGNIWFGTWGGGVCKYDGKYFSNYTEKEGLSDNSIGAMLIDKYDNLWIGTERGYVTKFDGKSFTYFTDKHGFSNSQIRTIIEDRHGNIWFGTFDGGITIYDGNRVEALEKGEKIPESETTDLQKINGKYYKTFRRFSSNDGLPTIDIITMLEDNAGSIWIGTNGDGLYKYDGKAFVHYNKKDGFNGPFVRSLLADENNNLWIATNGNGVYKFDGQTFTNYTENDGLSSDNVTSLVKDRDGNIWMGTTNGIMHIKNVPKTETEDAKLLLFNLDQLDGLKGNNFRINSVLLDHNNNLWFGNSKALNTINLNTFKFPTSKPNVQLNSVKISDEFIDFSSYKRTVEKQPFQFSSVASYYNYPINLVLPYNLNHLTFNFSATDWSAPQKIKYRYILENLDNDWSNVSFRSFADYRNIPPGKFTFKIQAIGIAGLWSNTFEYSFEVHPPWWKTWWFRICLALCLIGVGIGFYYFRLNSLLFQRELLEKKVDKRTYELKQALKELKNTQLHLVQSERLASIGVLSSGLAHEINNPLNFIQGGVAAIENYINKNFKEHIKNISPIIDMIYTGINRATGIIINLENFNRKSETNPDNCDINEIINNCLDILHNKMSNKIEIIKNFTTETYSLNGNRGDLHQAILNILLNAEESIADKGIISIFTKVENQKINIHISDNGCGISKENLTRITDPFFSTKDPGKGTGFGLSIAHNIIEEHKGTLGFQSEPGNGTTVLINLPIL